jgi:hypothetical protein
MKSPLFPYVLSALFAIAIAALEWWRYYRPGYPKPWLMTMVAGLVILILIVNRCCSCKQED